MSNKVNIIITGDDGYFPHTCAMVISLLENAQNPKNINFFYLDGGINIDNRQYLKSIVENYQSEIEYLIIDGRKFSGFRVSDHINQTTYYRILAPSILPKGVKRAIYLDSDLIVLRDIKEFFCTSLKGKLIGGITDPHGCERFAELNILNEKYFNAGVLLIDIEQWRENQLSTKLFLYINENNTKLKYWDQDALNAVLNKDWLEIDPTWNVQTSFYFEENKAKYIQVIKNPSIVHYTTGLKPWHVHSNHPLKSEYFKYLGMTKWRNYSFLNLSLKEKLKTSTKNIIFGSGEMAKSFLTYTDEKIEYLVDNDRQKWNLYISDIEIKSPENLLNEDKDKITIIICSMYFNEISEQLNEMGFELNTHYFKMH